jgi:leucyl-tRNA synthetase
MSKSRGNVVNPDDVVEEFGADSLRLYEMFMGPLEQSKPWQTSGLQGMRRFLDRVHAVAHRPLVDGAIEGDTAKLVHRTVKKVTDDIEALRFNTAISAMMILANHLAGQSSPHREAVEKLVLCLSPYAPHLAEELWCAMGHAASIADAAWPSYDEALTVDDVVELAVQVNGRVRGRLQVSREAEAEQVREAALQEPNVAKHVEGRAVKKFIYVPGRIANLIVT